jgi:transcriptional regulator of acetoin/glycerol metabolism
MNLDEMLKGRWNEVKLRLQKEYLMRLLHATGGNVSQVARVSGIDRGLLYRAFSRCGINLAEVKRTIEGKGNDGVQDRQASG